MPGRARLLAASFLTKTLHVDWRVGARHFLDLLVDRDIANNQWLPELRNLDAPMIHRAPHLAAAARADLDYPAPIVDLATATARFREGRGPAGSHTARG
ncbi:hypothetical protein AQI70_08055 [Streptomyces curacoi]|uniref:Cryptochrome/DNA photolyase FAD-binding domain-containing protein n=1 Tax=Streptomyces curacoi TaxID=146536 RepID=A0A117PI82_9ACTN|nr:hypothetical protein AQI70_08055 [Streptomyces curacoi]